MYTIVYADDIAFYAFDTDVYSLRSTLQGYLDLLTGWLHSLSLELNILKCSLLFFSVSSGLNLQLLYKGVRLRQVKKMKYLGIIIYDGKFPWKAQVAQNLIKGSETCGRFRSI